MDTYLKAVDGFVSARSILSAHPQLGGVYSVVILMAGVVRETTVSGTDAVRKLLAVVQDEKWIETHPREYLNPSTFGGAMVGKSPDGTEIVTFYLRASTPSLEKKYEFAGADAAKVLAALGSR